MIFKLYSPGIDTLLGGYFYMTQWILNDQTTLYGKDAERYLSEQLTDFTELSLYIDTALKECKSFNKITKNDSLAYSVINANENLSMIEFILEDLLEQMKLKLGHYFSL